MSYGYLVRVHVVHTVPVTWAPSCGGCSSSSSLLDRLHLRPSTTLMLGVERLTWCEDKSLFLDVWLVST